MKTIAQQLGIKDFPFQIKDKSGNIIYHEESDGFWSRIEWDSKGNRIYWETSSGFWVKREYDSNGEEIYFENSNGTVLDNRPKPSCEDKVVEIDGKKYKLTQIK